MKIVVNLYSAKNDPIAAVCIEAENGNADTTSLIRWKDRLFRFETPDRARECGVIDADAKAVLTHETAAEKKG